MRLKAIVIGLMLGGVGVFVIVASFLLEEPLYEVAAVGAVALAGSVFLIVCTVKDFRRHRASKGELLSDVADLLS